MQTLMIAENREALVNALLSELDENTNCITFVSRTPEEIGDCMQRFPKVIHAVPNVHTATVCLLRVFKIPPHTDGYRQLVVAIPLYAHDRSQCFSKELYPAVASSLGYSSGIAVEHSIRNSIHSAWKHRDPVVWDALFPSGRKPPSNTRFISALAELLK